MAGIATVTASLAMAGGAPAGLSSTRADKHSSILTSHSCPVSVSVTCSFSGEHRGGAGVSCSAMSSSASEVLGFTLDVNCLTSPAPSRGSRCGHTLARAHTATWGETEAKATTLTQSRFGEGATLYELLGISQGVSSKEVKAAYRQLARKLHPDVAPPQEKEECTKNFLKIHSAYTTLCDPQRKAAYDLQLSMQRHQANGYGSRYSTPISSNWESASSYAAPSYYATPNTYAYQWKGRSWETDQCW